MDMCIPQYDLIYPHRLDAHKINMKKVAECQIYVYRTTALIFRYGD